MSIYEDALKRSEGSNDDLLRKKRLDELAREEGYEDFAGCVKAEAEIPILWEEQPWLESIARGINLSVHYEKREPVWLAILEQLYIKNLIDGRTYLTMVSASL